MASAYARFKTRNEILIAQHRVKRHRMTRRLYLAYPPVDAAGDVRQVRGHFEWSELPYRRHRSDKLLDLLLEPFALAFAIGTPRHAGNERAPDPGLDHRRSPAGDAQYTPGLEVIPFARVMQRRFVTQHRTYRVGKHPFGIFATGIAHQVDLIGEPVIESREGAVSERPVGVQFGWTSRVEV